MADINAAWHVLSEPARRAVYDASLTRPMSSTASSMAEPSAHTPSGSPVSSPIRQLLDPPRFPWRGVLLFAAVGSVGVVVLSLFAQPALPPPVDNLLTPGSCVRIEAGQVAREVACDDPHDAVVRQLIPFDTRCPSDTTTLRDRQGMGWACVDTVEGA
jgi:molecular chaperone DnaJ